MLAHNLPTTVEIHLPLCSKQTLPAVVLGTSTSLSSLPAVIFYSEVRPSDEDGMHVNSLSWHADGMSHIKSMNANKNHPQRMGI